MAGVAAVRRALPPSARARRPAGRRGRPPVRATIGPLHRRRLGHRASRRTPTTGWGCSGIEVDPAHRRQGLALAVIGALLEWGAERGAGTAYLQVTSDNGPALALYARIGFVTHHAYRYLAPPPAG